MFSLKVRTFFISITVWLGLIASGQAMPGCGVCSEPGGTFQAFAQTGQTRAQASIDTWAFGEKKVLYIRVNYSDDLSEPVPAAEMEGVMQQVSDFYRKHSHGQFWTVATITPVVQLPREKAHYFPVDEEGNTTWQAYQLLADAREAARQAGYDPADYDLDMVRFNAPMWRSFANVGSPGAWMLTSDVATTIHELGHNLGLHHANTWNGEVNGTGWNVEYGDEFDIMGNPFYFRLAGFHAINKRTLGWLGQENEVTAEKSGVYRIYAHDGAEKDPSRPYVLRVRKDAERDYWIEKRQLFDLYEYMEQSGVLVYWHAWSRSNQGTQLLDPTPDAGETLPLQVPLADEEAGVRIIPLAQAEDRSYVDVAVIFGSGKLSLLPGLLHFSGTAGQSYRFERSADLRSWTPFAQKSSATGDLLVPVAQNAARSFYRVVAEPDRT